RCQTRINDVPKTRRDARAEPLSSGRSLHARRSHANGALRTHLATARTSNALAVRVALSRRAAQVDRRAIALSHSRTRAAHVPRRAARHGQLSHVCLDAIE